VRRNFIALQHRQARDGSGAYQVNIDNFDGAPEAEGVRPGGTAIAEVPGEAVEMKHLHSSRLHF
jgi:hypothetical protein